MTVLQLCSRKTTAISGVVNLVPNVTTLKNNNDPSLLVVSIYSKGGRPHGIMNSVNELQ